MVFSHAFRERHPMSRMRRRFLAEVAGVPNDMFPPPFMVVADGDAELFQDGKLNLGEESALHNLEGHLSHGFRP